MYINSINYLSTNYLLVWPLSSNTCLNTVAKMEFIRQKNC